MHSNQAEKFLKSFYEKIHQTCKAHFKSLNDHQIKNNNWFDAECIESKNQLNKLFKNLFNSRTIK